MWDGAERPGPRAEGFKKMSSPALLLQVGKLRIKEGMGPAEVTDQVRASAGPELRCPAFQTGCICGWTGEALSLQGRALHSQSLPALSIPNWPNPSGDLWPSGLALLTPTKATPAGPLPEHQSTGYPLPFSADRPENRTPTQMKSRAMSRAYQPDFSHFTPIFDSEDMLCILKRS